METIYNGIILPGEWPPQYSVETLQKGQPVPYLDTPPAVININIGRQLFIDDFLIQSTNLKRRFYRAEKCPLNPIFSSETQWEKDETLPGASPKSGGIWWDDKEKIYRMWYEAGWLNRMAYAESDDGIHWKRPVLDIIPGTNLILNYNRVKKMDASVDPFYLRPDSTAVIPDYGCPDDSQRYKLFLRNPGPEKEGICMTSADGIHWGNAVLSSPVGDRSTAFYNPFRKKWVFSIRSFWSGRSRDYAEGDDFLKGADFEKTKVKWLCTDTGMRPDPYVGFVPQLYNVDAIAYESVMLGMFQVMYGPANSVCQKTGAPKLTELISMFSRDGFHFSKPSNQSIIQASRIEGTWDRGYVQSVCGGLFVTDDKIRIYYIGFSGDCENDRQQKGDWCFDGMYSGGATGFAVLRRDGFVSMETDGGGVLITKPVKFDGKKNLFVNFKGSLRVVIFSSDGAELAVSEPVTGDSTKMMIFFPNFDLVKLNEKPIQFRFDLKEGEIYSFWVSEDPSGTSRGYMGAGGPDYPGGRDLKGR
jgi:hypothetical protein